MPSAQILPDEVYYPSRFRMRNIPATTGAKHIWYQKSFFSFFSPHLQIFCILNIQDFAKKKSRKNSAHVSDIKCFFITFCFTNRIQKIRFYLDICIYTTHFVSIFQIHTMKSQQGRWCPDIFLILFRFCFLFFPGSCFCM